MVGVLRRLRAEPGVMCLLTLVIATVVITARAPEADLYSYNLCLLASMGALSLNLLMGTAGQVSVGSAAFLAVGAFIAVFVERQGLPSLVGIVAAAAGSGLIGIVVGIPAVRLRGLYLALSTLAAYFIVIFALTQYQSATVGTSVLVLPGYFSSYGFLEAQRYWAWLLLVAVAGVLYLATRVSRGRSGRALRMVRDQEIVAAALGIDVLSTKLAVFGLSSVVFGFQGAIFAQFLGNVSAENFTFGMSVAYIAMIVIGGLDSVAGAIVGAFFVTAMPTYLPQLVDRLPVGANIANEGPQIGAILYGVLLIVFVLAPRGGVVSMASRLIGRLK